MIDRNGITKASDSAIRKAMLNTPNSASPRLRSRYIGLPDPGVAEALGYHVGAEQQAAASSALNRPTAVANEYFRLTIPERYT